MSTSPPDTPNKLQLRQRRREEMEQMFFVLLKRQHMQDVVRMMGSEFSCPVCQSIVSRATLANCGHMFCQKCIRTWCIEYGRRNCPVCRVQIVARVRVLPVDRFVRKCLEEAGEHEVLKELEANEAAGTVDEGNAVFESDRVQVRATAATFYVGNASSANASSNAGPNLTVRSTAAASTGASGWVGSFGVSTD